MVVCCNKPLIIALALLSAGSSLAFSSTKSITPPRRGLSLSSLSSLAVEEEQQQIIGIDRPLLRQFGNRISERVLLIQNMDIIGKIIILLLLMGMMHIRLRRLYPV